MYNIGSGREFIEFQSELVHNCFEYRHNYPGAVWLEKSFEFIKTNKWLMHVDMIMKLNIELKPMYNKKAHLEL